MSPRSSPGSPPLRRDSREWRLGSADPRDQGRFMWRLHTLDIYFWMDDDAKSVVDTLKRLLHPSQLDLLEKSRPADRHPDGVSPVVQQLENVAISDPAYRNGQTRNSQNQATSLPLPPPPGVFAVSPLSSSRETPAGRDESVSARSDDPPVNFVPIAYNPAAPAAPEPIAHREKTPPPADAAEGTGLAAAAITDHAPGYHIPQAQQYTGFPTGGHYGSPPPPPPPGTYAAPPAPQPLHHNPSISSNDSSQRFSTTSSFAISPPNTTNAPGRSASIPQSFAPPPQHLNPHLYGAASPPAVQTPGSQIYGSPPFGQQAHQPSTHVHPQYADYLSSRPPPPVGGYSQYSYDQQPQMQSSQNQYDIHSQVYRPTEIEAAHPQTKSSSGGQKSGKLESRLDHAEKGVNRFLKRLEKKL